MYTLTKIKLQNVFSFLYREIKKETVMVFALSSSSLKPNVTVFGYFLWSYEWMDGSRISTLALLSKKNRCNFLAYIYNQQWIQNVNLKVYRWHSFYQRHICFIHSEHTFLFYPRNRMQLIYLPGSFIPWPRQRYWLTNAWSSFK